MLSIRPITLISITLLNIYQIASVELDLRDEIRTKFEIRNHIPGRLLIERSYPDILGKRPLDGIQHIPSAKIRGHYFPAPNYIRAEGYVHTPAPKVSGNHKDTEPIKGLRYFRGRHDRFRRMHRGDAEKLYRAYRVYNKRYIPMTRPSVKASSDVFWPVDWPSPVLNH